MYKNFIYKKISMKKSLKNFGLAWLAALSLAGTGQKTLASNTQQNKENILQALDTKKESKTDESKNYNTASDFKEQQASDSLDITKTVSLLQDTIHALVKSYGKDGLNKKINEIKEKYPNFESLSEAKQKEIVMEKFLDKPESINAFVWDIVIFILIIRLAIWLSGLGSTYRRRY